MLISFFVFPLKPALNQKGLRQVIEIVNGAEDEKEVETCPESEGIATKGGGDYPRPQIYLVETCPESEGIATSFFGEKVNVDLLSTV